MTRSRKISLVALTAFLMLCATGTVSARAAPFGAPHPATAMSSSGLMGWIFAEQAAFYRSLSGFIRASKEDKVAMWALFGISFVYGIFHAIGPGHGKAVISSYLVANDETWRRGVALSFVSAGIQSIVAIIVVAIAAVLLGATAKAIGLAVRLVEVISYILVIMIGLRLLYVKSRGFLIACRELTWRRAPDLALASVSAGHASSTMAFQSIGQRPRAMAMRGGQCQVDGCIAHGFQCDGDHDHHASAWGHAHGPEPTDLAGDGGWQRGLAAVVAVGLRPCSGAIIVLIFALAQDLFWTGVGATLVMGLGTAISVAGIATFAVGARRAASRIAESRAGTGMLIVRAIEIGASTFIVAFGGLLLAGYLASEQLWMFTG
ncbi:nickel/cobalt transporter [Bradyrhizobium diversitatis]|uniref:Nickel/cobalt efflux system n=1 Tax=Bradyrhizobium diversitatis TaxID=2755406 RepID=A0ABS0P698_9BRAD|nr:nickel transporter [Bradyrhizobium diversitatis]MBH5388577.1 nickel transporter [Bradyrhizobium diversitatis]